ncbi:MAG TPA: thiamine pyrophosphate-dependent enzyme, partial [Stellaceae bacterium]|nr:thiamine pyrophosphate-dependent enzyme [Stellaceae bacterium]
RRIPTVPATRPNEADVEMIAERVINARNPVILADTAGRDPTAFTALVELADLFGVPVGSGRGAGFANFPKDHPLHLGSAIEPFLKDADLVLLIGCKAPWYPPSRKPTAGTIVAIDDNPLKGTMVYQSQQADHYLEGNIASSLQLLVAAAKAGGVTAAKNAERRAQWQREHERITAAQLAVEANAKGADRIEPLALVGALREAMPSDTIYVEETITHAGMLRQHLPWSQPQSFFHPGGGLGQGLGMALGVKLGAPNRPVAALIGDGSFLYNPVVQALGASRASGLPILIIVCNNGQYRAMQTGHLHHYPDGVAQEADIWHGVAIDGPDYAELGKPFGFHGQKVDKPGQLPDAIRAAMRAVEDGNTAILNIVLTQ